MAKGACVVGGVCMARGCMAGGVHGGVGGMRGRRDGHCSGWYASNWNAFLFTSLFHFLTEFALKRHDVRRLS